MRCVRLSALLLLLLALGCGDELPRPDATVSDQGVDLAIDSALDSQPDSEVPDALVKDQSVDAVTEDQSVDATIDAPTSTVTRTGRFVFRQEGESYTAFLAIYDASPEDLDSFAPQGCVVTEAGGCTAVECDRRERTNPFTFLSAGEVRLRLNNVARLYLDQNAEGFYFRNSDTDMLFDPGATLKVEADGTVNVPAFSVEGAIAPPGPEADFDDVIRKGQEFSTVWSVLNTGSAMVARFEMVAGSETETTEIFCEVPVADEILTVPTTLTDKMVGNRARVRLAFQNRYTEAQGNTMMQIFAISEVTSERAVR